jgi:integral membrane protein
MNNLPRLSTALGRLRVAVYVEGLTLLALVAVGMPLKHLAGRPELVAFLGPIHGVAFLVYALWLVECSVAGRWPASEILKLSVAAFIPLGFLSSRRLLARKDAEERAGTSPPLA